MYTSAALDLRSFGVVNGLVFYLLLLLEAVRVGGEVIGVDTESRLHPKSLPKDELVSLPLVARDVAPEPGNTTSTGGAAGLKVGAGWNMVSQAKDRQSYYAMVTVGDVNFRVALDTGSSDLWLISTACETEQCRGVPRYPLSYQSPSFQSINGNTTVFSASYADGSAVSGFVAKEKVELGRLTLTNQTFALISNSNVTMSDQESGILGLGFPRLSTISNINANFTPLFGGLSQQGLLDYPLFGLSLTRNQTGSLSLGAVDASIVTNRSHISWNDVAQFSPFGMEGNTSSYLHWATRLSSFSVNGTQLSPLPTQAGADGNVSLALFDVGTPGIYGPYQDVSRLYNLIDGARLVDSENGRWVVPCDTKIPVSLTFGRGEYTLLPSDYIIGPASGNPNLCFSWPQALPPSSDGIDWQIGSAFLQTVYSIFSYGIDGKEPPKIGLYPLTTAFNGTATEKAPSGTASTVESTTIFTTLPNSLVPTPTFTTPTYIFNTSVPASIGGIVRSGLATSTYSPILAHAQATDGFNASAIPTVLPPLVTLTLTDGSGSVTTVATVSLAAVTLGVPPGWNSGISVRDFHPLLGPGLCVQVFVVTLLQSYF